ncbi:MAG: hypothetical protein LBD23_12085 [Oscillospiraceae bacterium]|jgi:hypothetical protein|nr:hypothetical protein [Oscillospiraceae bacterium]
MSAGGLGGVVYVVPTFENGELHNLGQYLIDEELPMFIKSQGKENIKTDYILIEPTSGLNIGVVDYLNWGSYYADIANGLIDSEMLASKIDSEKRIIEKLISTLNQTKVEDVTTISKLIEYSVVLKPVFFETILETLFLQQPKSFDCELSNSIVKNLIFKLNPKLTQKFSMNNITCTITDLFFYTDIQFLYTRLNKNISKYFINNENNLIGHLMFRGFEIRQLVEYKFAKKLWEEAKEKNINIITYQIPKGEFGVLPVDNFKFFKCKIENGRIYKLEEIDIKLERELIIKNTVMRNPYTNEVKNESME